MGYNEKEAIAMFKKLIYAGGLICSFWIGALLASVGYANGSKEERKKWDKLYKF